VKLQLLKTIPPGLFPETHPESKNQPQPEEPPIEDANESEPFSGRVEGDADQQRNELPTAVAWFTGHIILSPTDQTAAFSAKSCRTSNDPRVFIHGLESRRILRPHMNGFTHSRDREWRETPMIEQKDVSGSETIMIETPKGNWR
jgi:hypothetical protein